MDEIDEAARLIEAALAGSSGLAIVVMLDFGADGALYVDGPGGRVTRDAIPADTALKMSFGDFKALARRRLDPMTAYRQGRLKVKGDLNTIQALMPLVRGLGR